MRYCNTVKKEHESSEIEMRCGFMAFALEIHKRPCCFCLPFLARNTSDVHKSWVCEVDIVRVGCFELLVRKKALIETSFTHSLNPLILCSCGLL